MIYTWALTSTNTAHGVDVKYTTTRAPVERDSSGLVLDSLQSAYLNLTSLSSLTDKFTIRLNIEDTAPLQERSVYIGLGTSSPDQLNTSVFVYREANTRYPRLGFGSIERQDTMYEPANKTIDMVGTGPHVMELSICISNRKHHTRAVELFVDSIRADDAHNPSVRRLTITTPLLFLGTTGYLPGNKFGLYHSKLRIAMVELLTNHVPVRTIQTFGAHKYYRIRLRGTEQPNASDNYVVMSEIGLDENKSPIGTDASNAMTPTTIASIRSTEYGTTPSFPKDVLGTYKFSNQIYKEVVTYLVPKCKSSNDKTLSHMTDLIFEFAQPREVRQIRMANASALENANGVGLVKYFELYHSDDSLQWHHIDSVTVDTSVWYSENSIKEYRCQVWQYSPMNNGQFVWSHEVDTDPSGSFTNFSSSTRSLYLSSGSVKYGKYETIIPPNEVSYSVTVWIKTVAEISSKPQDIFWIGNNSNVYYEHLFRIETSGKLRVYSSPTSFVESSSVIQKNLWHHVAYTWDSLNQVKIYINGILEGSGTVTPVLFGSVTPTTFLVGNANITDESTQFVGYLNNCAGFSAMLTESQVSAIYNAGVPRNLSSLDSAKSIYAWWSFENQSGADFSPWGRHLNMEGAVTYPLTKPTAPVLNRNGLKLVRTDATNYPFNNWYYPAGLDDPFLNGIYSEFSMSFWIRVDSTSIGTANRVLGGMMNPSSTLWGQFAMLNSNTNASSTNVKTGAQFCWTRIMDSTNTSPGSTSYAQVYTDTTINDGNWHHICITMKPTAFNTSTRLGTFTFATYIDGIDRTTLVTVTQNGSNSSVTSHANTVSGYLPSLYNNPQTDAGDLAVTDLVWGASRHRKESNSLPFDFYIDEHCVFNRALTESEVLEIYNPASNIAMSDAASSLLAWWRFEDPLRPGLDHSGYHRHLVPYPVVTQLGTSPGESGRSLLLGTNNTSNYAFAPNAETWNPLYDVSVFAWIQYTGSTMSGDNFYYGDIITRGSPNGGPTVATTNACVLRVYTSSQEHIQFSLVLPGVTPLTTTDARFVCYKNQWVHVGYTITANTNPCTMTIYANGFPLATRAFDPSGVFTNYNPNQFWIGRDSTGGSNPVYNFSGLVQDVAIWNRAFSSSEVKTVYQQGANLSFTGNLQGHWSFQGNGNDVSGKGRHLTVVGGSYVYDKPSRPSDSSLSTRIPFRSVYLAPFYGSGVNSLKYPTSWSPPQNLSYVDPSRVILAAHNYPEFATIFILNAPGYDTFLPCTSITSVSSAIILSNRLVVRFSGYDGGNTGLRCEFYSPLNYNTSSGTVQENPYWWPSGIPGGYYLCSTRNNDIVGVASYMSDGGAPTSTLRIYRIDSTLSAISSIYENKGTSQVPNLGSYIRVSSGTGGPIVGAVMLPVTNPSDGGFVIFYIDTNNYPRYSRFTFNGNSYANTNNQSQVLFSKAIGSKDEFLQCKFHVFYDGSVMMLWGTKRVVYDPNNNLASFQGSDFGDTGMYNEYFGSYKGYAVVRMGDYGVPKRYVRIVDSSLREIANLGDLPGLRSVTTGTNLNRLMYSYDFGFDLKWNNTASLYLGPSGQFAVSPNGMAVTGTRSFSIWFKVESYGVGIPSMPLMCTKGSGSAWDHRLRGLVLFNDGSLSVHSTSESLRTSSGKILLGAWNHACVSYDKSNLVQLYLNGTLEASETLLGLLDISGNSAVHFGGSIHPCSSVSLNGSSQYFTTNMINLGAASAITIAVWCYRNANSSYFIVDQGNNAANEMFQIAILSGGEIRFSQNASDHAFTPTGGTPLKTWFHLVVSYSYASKTSRIFYNGVLGSSYTHASNMSYTSTLVHISRLANSANGYWNGYLAELAFYPSVLSESDINKLYNYGNPVDLATLALSSTPIAYYPFQNLNGSSVPNSMSGQYALTAFGSPTSSLVAPCNGYPVYLDEATVWSKALTPSDVAELYNGGVPTDPQVHASAFHLVAYWPMENLNDDSTVSRDSVNTNHLTLVGTPVTNQDTPPLTIFQNKKSLFLESSGGYLERTNTVWWETPAWNLSIAAWIRLPIDSSGTRTVWSLSSLAGTTLTQIRGLIDTGNRVSFEATGASVSASTTVLALNTWYHLTWVLSSSRSSVQVYINGVQDTSLSIYSGSGTAVDASVNRFCLGASRLDASTIGDYYRGYLDEVGIWGSALSANEVAAVYNHGYPFYLYQARGAYVSSRNLTGYYRFDSSGNDSSLQGNHLTFTNGSISSNVMTVLFERNAPMVQTYNTLRSASMSMDMHGLFTTSVQTPTYMYLFSPYQGVLGIEKVFTGYVLNGIIGGVHGHCISYHGNVLVILDNSYYLNVYEKGASESWISYDFSVSNASKRLGPFATNARGFPRVSQDGSVIAIGFQAMTSSSTHNYSSGTLFIYHRNAATWAQRANTTPTFTQQRSDAGDERFCQQVSMGYHGDTVIASQHHSQRIAIFYNPIGTTTWIDSNLSYGGGADMQFVCSPGGSMIALSHMWAPNTINMYRATNGTNWFASTTLAPFGFSSSGVDQMCMNFALPSDYTFFVVTTTKWYLYEFTSGYSDSWNLTLSGNFTSAFTATPRLVTNDSGILTVSGDNKWIQVNTGTYPKHRLIPVCRGTPPTQVDVPVSYPTTFIDQGKGVTIGANGYAQSPANWETIEGSRVIQNTSTGGTFSLRVFTLSFWYKTASTWSEQFIFDAGYEQYLDAWPTPITPQYGFCMVESNNDLTFYSNDGSTPVILNLGVGKSNNVWRHVMVTCDGSMFSVYVNGMLRKTTAINTSIRPPFIAFHLNTSYEAVTSSSTTTQYDDLSIFNRVLTQAEIESLAIGINPATISGIAHLYTFDNNNGNDSIGTEHLTIVNGTYGTYTPTRTTGSYAGIVRSFSAIDAKNYQVFSNAYNSTAVVNQYNHTFSHMMQLQSIPQQIGTHGIICLPEPRIVTGYIVTNGTGGSWTTQPTSKAATSWRLQGTNDTCPWSSLSYDSTHAMYFNGTTSKASITTNFNYISVPFTFSLWFRSSSVIQSGSGYSAFLLDPRSSQHTADFSIGLKIESNIPKIIVNDATIVSTWTDLQWHHILFTTDGSNIAKVYIDGQFAANTSTTSYYASLEAVTLGTRYTDPTAAQQYYIGYMSEVAVLNILVEPTTVTEIYQNGSIRDLCKTSVSSNLVGYWKLDGNGNDNKGSKTLTLTAISYSLQRPPLTTAPLYPIRAMVFNGSSSMAYPVTNYDYTSEPWTFVCWFRASTDTGNGMYLMDGKVSSDNAIAYITLNSVGVVAGLVTFSSCIWRDLLWHHVVYTSDGSSAGKFYYDGVYQGDVNSSSIYRGIEGITLGSRRTGASSQHWFHGYITEAAVYNAYLDASQVAGVYNNGFITDLRYVNVNTNLVSYWKTLDNGQDVFGTRHLNLTSVTYSSVPAPAATGFWNPPNWTTLHTVGYKSNMNAVFQIPNNTAYSAYRFIVDSTDGTSELLLQYTLQYSQGNSNTRVSGRDYVRTITLCDINGGSSTSDATYTLLGGNSKDFVGIDGNNGAGGIAGSHVTQPYLKFFFVKNFTIKSVSVLVYNGELVQTRNVGITLDNPISVTKVISSYPHVEKTRWVSGTLAESNYITVLSEQSVRLYFYADSTAGDVYYTSVYSVVFNRGMPDEIEFY